MPITCKSSLLPSELAGYLSGTCRVFLKALCAAFVFHELFAVLDADNFPFVIDSNEDLSSVRIGKAAYPFEVFVFPTFLVFYVLTFLLKHVGLFVISVNLFFFLSYPTCEVLNVRRERNYGTFRQV